MKASKWSHSEPSPVTRLMPFLSSGPVSTSYEEEQTFPYDSALMRIRQSQMLYQIVDLLVGILLDAIPFFRITDFHE